MGECGGQGPASIHFGCTMRRRRPAIMSSPRVMHSSNGGIILQRERIVDVGSESRTWVKSGMSRMGEGTHTPLSNQSDTFSASPA